MVPLASPAAGDGVSPCDQIFTVGRKGVSNVTLGLCRPSSSYVTGRCHACRTRQGGEIDGNGGPAVLEGDPGGPPPRRTRHPASSPPPPSRPSQGGRSSFGFSLKWRRQASLVTKFRNLAEPPAICSAQFVYADRPTGGVHFSGAVEAPARTVRPIGLV